MKAAAAEIDPLRPFFARYIHLQKRPLGGNRRHAFVPEGDGKVRQPLKIADEGARRLRARAFGAIHIDRKADDDATDIVALERGKKRFGVLREFLAHHHLTRRRQRQSAVGDRKTDGLGAEVEPGQRLARSEKSGEFLQVDH